jgi:heme oxygenase (biliverdin-IX-beta and delta-forming)
MLDLRLTHDYRTFLEVIAAALLPLEAALGRVHVERLFPDWGRRARSGAILADLDRLGGVVRRLSAPDEPGLDELQIDGLGGILGTMYVLEGSRLGARMLLRQASQSADPEVQEARAYLSHGAGTNFWQTFLAALEFHGARVNDDGTAVRAARNAFDLFSTAASSAPVSSAPTSSVGSAPPQRIKVHA